MINSRLKIVANNGNLRLIIKIKLHDQESEILLRPDEVCIFQPFTSLRAYSPPPTFYSVWELRLDSNIFHLSCFSCCYYLDWLCRLFHTFFYLAHSFGRESSEQGQKAPSFFSSHFSLVNCLPSPLTTRPTEHIANREPERFFLLHKLRSTTDVVAPELGKDRSCKQAVCYCSTYTYVRSEHYQRRRSKGREIFGAQLILTTTTYYTRHTE